MSSPYILQDASAVFSPALLFYKEQIRGNIARTLEIAGKAERLRLHVKTHKTREIVGMELASGITKHKCATLAEAEMLADCSVPDILLAYPLVGPNCGRFARLIKAYPDSRFSVTVDSAAAAKALSAALVAHDQQTSVLLDLDVGQHRTGIAPGPAAYDLLELLGRLPGLRVGGLHAYDGHNHQDSFAERSEAVLREFAPVQALREALGKQGLPVERLVVGGTPTFPIFAGLDVPGLECSPGTCILHDHGYGSRFSDLTGFTPAAVLITRVVSRPAANRLTLDLGTKAVASDPPAGKRCLLLDVPEYKPVAHNEEHFVIETPAAERFQLGDVIYALPTHICPTVALHRQAFVIENGKITERWDIVARDRMLRIS